MRSAFVALLLGAVMTTVGCVAGQSQNQNQNNSSTPKLQSIHVDDGNASIIVGQTAQLTATGSFSNNTTQDLSSSASWSSSDTTIATVSSSGLLTAIKSGTVTITASQNSISGSLQLTIAPKLDSIAITPSSSAIAAQTTQQFTAIGTFSDQSTKDITLSVTWNSSNTAVATIGNGPTAGLATGATAGSTTITATAGSVTSNTATLTVTSATATTLTISPNGANLALDTSKQFTAEATFSDGSQQDVTNVTTWSSSSSSIATITVSGLVTGKSLGTATISGSFEGKADSTSLTVDASNLSSISIQVPYNGSIAQGTKATFTATGTFNDGSTHNLTQIVTWSSDNTGVLTFTSPGQAAALAPGNVTVQASLNGSSVAPGTVSFTVTGATISSITVTPVNQTIPIGWHQTFTATAVFSDGSSQDISEFAKWSSNNAAVTFGTGVNEVGLAAAQGSATVTASFSFAGASASGTSDVTVDATTLTSISVSPATPLLAPGANLQFNATGTWGDGKSQILNTYATWHSTNSNIVQVSVAGVATGESTGTATITATMNAVTSNNANVIVESSALQSIQITPQSLKLPAGIETQLKATGTFANGGTLDLTSTVTWTSSNPSFATISNAVDTSGIISGITPGTTTISASFAGVQATETVNVTTATLTSIAISPSEPTINLGTSEQFMAQGSFNDGSSVNISLQVAWTSSNVAVANIKSNGLATSASRGTTTIGASLDGASDKTTLTVQ